MTDDGEWLLDWKLERNFADTGGVRLLIRRPFAVILYHHHTLP